MLCGTNKFQSCPTNAVKADLRLKVTFDNCVLEKASEGRA
jgi:hypothetical protein